MPAGYRKSSGNTAALVAQGRRVRGGPVDSVEASHGAGVAPVGPLTAEPQAADWCGHAWSAWTPLAEAGEQLGPGLAGLYRIRACDMAGLLYLGQGSIAARLASHLRTATSMAGRQGQVFAT